MPGRALAISPGDAALPGLDRALDPDAVLVLLGRAGRLDPSEGLTCAADILSHKPGQRCTIAYTISRPGHPVSAEVIGKLYRRARLAKRVFEWTAALSGSRSGKSAPGGVPAPLALEPELGLVLQARASGADLRHALADRTAARPLALAARWLAALHASPPLAELRQKSLDHELAKLDLWCAASRPCLARAEALRLERARGRLHELARAAPSRPQVMIHRDFYYAHVIWDGRQVWILDLDQLAIGDAAHDVGHFLAHLENLALRVEGCPGAYRVGEAAFLAAYCEHACADVRRALPFYRAYTLLKLAATEVQRRRGDWRVLARALVGLAWREAGGPDEPSVSFSAGLPLDSRVVR